MSINNSLSVHLNDYCKKVFIKTDVEAISHSLQLCHVTGSDTDATREAEYLIPLFILDHSSTPCSSWVAYKRTISIHLHITPLRFFQSDRFLHITDRPPDIGYIMGVFHPSLKDFSFQVISERFLLENKSIPSLPKGPHSKQKDAIPRHGSLAIFPP